MDSIAYYLALNLATGINIKKKLELLHYFKEIKLLFSADQKEIDQLITGKVKSELISNRQGLLEQGEKELEKAVALNVGITHIDAPDYPENLKAIPDPPIALYYKGTLSQDDFNSVSVVGCRNATPYGLKNSYKLGYGLAQNGVTVVSGLAKGIDGEAHKGAIDGEGRTVAVLGCGIDRVYPKEHKELHEVIAQKGCLITEFPIGKEPKGFHFPIRNRIICGLSVGVVVVEGSKDSGSLYTAEFALDYGRELYAYPGPAQSYNYSGTHLLLKKGARLIENSYELLEDLSLVLDLELSSPKKNKKMYPQAKEIILNSIEENVDEKEKNLDLSDEENKVMNLLSFEKKHFDEIVNESQLQVNQISSAITKLVLKDLCIQCDGNYYIRNNN